MASGACSSFQVCDSFSGTGSFQNLPDTYTHVSGGTRNRKRKRWEVEDIPVVVQERSNKFVYVEQAFVKYSLRVSHRIPDRINITRHHYNDIMY